MDGKTILANRCTILQSYKKLKTELRRNHHLIAKQLKSFAYKFLFSDD